MAEAPDAPALDAEAAFAPKDAKEAEAYRARFVRSVELLGLRVPKAKLSVVTKQLKGRGYTRRGVRAVRPDPSGDEGWGVWLCPASVKQETDAPAELLKCKEEVGGELVQVKVDLDHSNFSQSEILTELLPKGMTVPLSFEGVGHIAHVNLRDEHAPHRFLIGRVLLDKNPGIRTVVNKLGVIDSEFREFRLEVLAGDPEMNAVVKQHGCTFHVPYDRVYWNSRLQTEHARLVKVFRKSDVLCDVMAGIGPFAIPAAKRGHRVFANDLNPASYEALVKNAKENDVAQLVQPSCEDGRVFVKRMRDKLLRGETESLPTGASVHFSMNLPASAVEFLDAFREDQGWDGSVAVHRAVVHVYCFSSAADFKADAQRQAEAVLGRPLGPSASVHHVRNVAPRKEMLCVSFRLGEPPSVGEGEKRRRQDG
eukprot:TRINITY_DN21224_c0_g1_i2.p1 TRINITY_DN21224_c0_g1~~TRINITY_DN21224_c0_g1_i2.p1  ORF type:complete len:424 (+),score=111.50 TRINITY_DN21224_c0_g1_i2:55-1326(+)